MYWVEKRLEQRNELQADRNKIASGTEPLWESLCQAMTDSVDSFYKAEPIGRFEVDGKNHHVYWVRHLTDTPNRNTERKKITVVLDRGERTITATYEGCICPRGEKFAARSVNLTIEGEHVCLHVESGNTQSTQAAAYLLDPFLFPDLANNPLPEVITYTALRSVGR